MKLDKYLTESDDLILDWGPDIWKILKKECKQFLKELKSTGLAGKWWIWRGASKNISNVPGYKEIMSRSDRWPKDMPQALHDKFDDDFYRRFKWRPRSEGVFTTSSKATAASYNRPYIFFPTDKYSFIWSPDISDLFTFADTSGLLSYGYGEYYEDWTWEQEYEVKFGEGRNGHWEYDGVEVGRSRDSRGIVTRDILDDIGDLYDPGLLEWVPDEDFESFCDRRREEVERDQEIEIETAVNSYTNKNLKKAIESRHEIAFDCISYYLVHELYSVFLKQMISQGSYQMRLPFKMDLDILKDKRKINWFVSKGGKTITFNG